MDKKGVIGFDNIGELFASASPEVGKEEVRTVNKHEVVTGVSYLIGVENTYSSANPMQICKWNIKEKK